MGANAQTSVPAFTAGQILTAQQQTEINTGIPVFATTTTRDAAFGSTGEKVLAEGQFAYIEASNTTQYYDGAAWQTLGGGLTLVKAETSFTSATSVTADSVFTSAYSNYLVNVRYSTSTTQPFYWKLRASGTSSSTNYNSQRLVVESTTTAPVRETSKTAEYLGFTSGGAFRCLTQLVLFGPQIAEATPFFLNNAQNSVAYTTPYIGIVAGNHGENTSYDGIELLVTTGTVSGSYTIYGYQK